MESNQERTAHFSLPVDEEHKAKAFRPFSVAAPHMRAFHLAWLSLFACFFSTFSIPPLIAVIREDLNFTDRDISNAGIASFLGSIFSRLAMGPVCDLKGPRFSSAALSLVTVPVVLATSLVTTPAAFIVVRFLIGFSLANFVANQFWMTCMFSSCVVGLANGVAAGWANTGSGVTQLVMPLIYSSIMKFGIPSSTAWRLAYIVPCKLNNNIIPNSVALLSQVAGSNIRYDWEWRDSGSCSDANTAIFRLKIHKANKHFSDGMFDDCVYTTRYLAVLPSRRWYVLQPFEGPYIT